MTKQFSRKMLRLVAVAQELAIKSLKRAAGSKAKRPAPIPLADMSVSDGFRVAITGANRGLGRAIAEGFIANGASVAVLCRDADDAKRVAAALGPKARGYGVDVGRAEQVEAAVAAIGQDLGGLDMLVNNAGVTGPLDAETRSMTAEAFNAVLYVNVTAAWTMARAAAGLMAPGGRIVNVSSGAVDATQPNMGAYAVSKHALEGVTQQLTQDLADSGIGICSIRLGSLRSDMTEKAFGKLKASLLPEPASMFPAFLALAQAPVSTINGRSFAGWRLSSDIAAELATATQMTAQKPFSYPTYEHQGRIVDRESPDFRVYDRAENQLGPSPRVAEVLTADLLKRPMQVYPDQGHDRLRNALAEAHGLTPAHFTIGNGSWEILDRLLELFTGNGDSVVASKPGWFGFNMLAGKRGLNVIKVPMRLRDSVWDHHLEAVAAAVGPTTRLVYLISPSNPEGIVLRREAVLKFLDALPKGLPVLLDEAYYEYVNDPEAISAFDLLDRDERPLFGLRTFSKFYALASMRVGYAYGRTEFIDLLNRGERIFNISHLSEKAAITALEDKGWQDHVRTVTLAERSRIEQALTDMGLDHIPSQAPYLLLELPARLDAVVDRFAEQGTFIGRKSFYKQKYLLLPISTEAENTRHLKVLRSFTR